MSCRSSVRKLYRVCINIMCVCIMWRRRMVCAEYSESACVDYAHVAGLAKQAGLANVHECPQDGISGVACRKQPRLGTLKNVADVRASDLNWSHVLVYMLVGGAGAKKDASRNKVRDWWLERLPVDVSLDVVLIGDAPSLSHASGREEDQVVDFASSMQSTLQATHPKHKIHLVRALPEVDAGYFRLACKTVTGMMRILEMTTKSNSSASTVMPNKRFFLKIDDDTAFLPSRVLSFLRTLDATTMPSAPVYFGTILNDHKPFLLCDELAWDERTPNATNPIYLFSQKSKDKDKEDVNSNNKGIVPICYAQGGAYGMNAAAFALFANTRACTSEMDLESTGEDAYVGFRIYKESKSTVIHCGSFRPHIPHTSNAREVWKEAFAFHHASNGWLQLATNLTLANPDDSPPTR